ncbi:geranylgeranyl transferase type-2 subunit alpha-like [Plakobranchus ocellatus]|uniref:Geranylgeranyl transferase type-2 subunit alpha n=1 Tax=Plakobranchus ocellatus TaxID=259542 RepID=A0AAV3ZKY9_9GAST|nr:geranylgeranyl transferase type-2 subunit alpha-like [Plakobranchus ocellatus]
MHGRLKVKSTAEQQEAKRKEREKKLQLYNGATSKIFSKELLHLCGEVLAVNPDFYTLWNFRKEVFLQLQKSKSPKELQNLFISELFFLESCLKMNPKSYGTWHHRCFIMDTMPEPDWVRELELCNQFLKYDERNFHCWDYRRFIVKRANISPEAELEFSMSKISNNFSNYSSWHYRSKLLPVIYPDQTQPMGVSEEALLKGETKQAIDSISVFQADQRVTVSFLQHIQVGKTANIVLECDGTKDVNLPTGVEFTLAVRLIISDAEVCSARLHIPVGDNTSKRWVPSGAASRFSQELSAVKTETLQQELESVTQLMEVETDNKWAVLTAVLLMKALDPNKNRVEIMQNLHKLEALDIKRTEYYRDLRSKFLVEAVIDAMDQKANQGEASSETSSALNLSARDLTKLYHPELLTLVTSADLSNNRLRDVRHFSFLQSIRELRLSDNCVKSCQGLEHLPHLERVFLDNNQLSSPESLSALVTCPHLKLLDLSGNPVLDHSTALEGIKEMLPDVEIITQHTS